MRLAPLVGLIMFPAMAAFAMPAARLEEATPAGIGNGALITHIY